MKYCCSSYIGMNYRKMCDEVKFPVYDLNSAIEYAKNNPHLRVIVSITDLFNGTPSINKLLGLHDTTDNIYYEFYKLQDMIKYAKYCQEEQYEDRHYMFGQPVVTWAMVMILKYYNVSDILIAEPLTFNMTNVAAGIKREGIKVRVCPVNTKHILATENKKDHSINHFFILPNYVNLYEYYIDVIELNQEASDTQREEALIRIYIQDEEYKHNLRFLLSNFDSDCNATILDEKFFRRRMNCGQTCLISENNCHYCSTLQKLEKMLIPPLNRKEEF